MRGQHQNCVQHIAQAEGDDELIVPLDKKRSIYSLSKTNILYLWTGLHKLCYPTIRDRSTWSKFGAHGEHGDVFLFSNLGVL